MFRSFGRLRSLHQIKTLPQDDVLFWGFAGSLVVSEFGALRKKVDVILNEVVTVTFQAPRRGAGHLTSQDAKEGDWHQAFQKLVVPVNICAGGASALAENNEQGMLNFEVGHSQ